MPSMTSGDLTNKRNARIIYSSVISNQRDLSNRSTLRRLNLSESDQLTKKQGAIFTTYEEQHYILYNSIILSGTISVSGSTSVMTQINFTGISDAGYGSQSPILGVLDDAFITLPMAGMVFNFFGTNYSNNISWNSNNALVFGTTFNPNTVSISANSAKSILLGNYDRLCTGIYYSNTSSLAFSINTFIVTFCDYFTNPGTPTYKYQIRLIKENIASQRQFVEVCVVSSPPSPGYSNADISYPSDVDASGNPIDSNGLIIDQTKGSPYNITNGVAFLNPCGATFSTSSPPAGSSFVFSSDSTGTTWSFNNNSFVNVFI
jgi:hypothetical protein